MVGSLVEAQYSYPAIPGIELPHLPPPDPQWWLDRWKAPHLSATSAHSLGTGAEKGGGLPLPGRSRYPRLGSGGERPSSPSTFLQSRVSMALTRCPDSCSYQDLVDSHEQMFLHCLYALGTISRHFKWLFLKLCTTMVVPSGSPCAEILIHSDTFPLCTFIFPF